MPDHTNDILCKLSRDPAVRAEVARAGSPHELRAAIARICKTHRIAPTPAQLRAALVPPEGELSDAELESVVGGKRDPDASEYIQGDNSYWADYYEDHGLWDSPAYDDTIDAGGGDDTVDGATGSDTIYGGEGNDNLDGYGINDSHGDSDEGDYLDGGAGNDAISGDLGNDTLLGGTGNDRLYGEEDNDYLDGGEDNDYLDGGSGNDILSGGGGNDTLAGGTGNDVLTGGAGNDVFAFGTNGGTDTITDFNPDSDRFQFNGASSVDDLDVSAHGGKTFISYGGTTIIVDGQEMTADEVWARANH